MRVLVFGASSAQGYWDSEGGWADRLKHYYDKLQIDEGFEKEYPRVINLGISGNTAADILRRIEPEVQARQNEKGIAIIIQVGSNNAAEVDGQTRSTIHAYQQELEQIIKKAKQYADKILIVGFPGVDEAKTNPLAWADLYFKNENIKKFESCAKETAKNQGVSFVPVFDNFIPGMNAHDGLHPNNQGHQLIFELVRPELDKLINT